MAILRKANFHTVNICRLLKNQSCNSLGARDGFTQSIFYKWFDHFNL